MATANDLRQMKPDELSRMLNDQRESLFNLKLKLRTGHLENSASLNAAKKDIARLATVLREGEMGIARAVKTAHAPKGEKVAKGEAKPKGKSKAKAASK